MPFHKQLQLTEKSTFTSPPGIFTYLLHRSNCMVMHKSTNAWSVYGQMRSLSMLSHMHTSTHTKWWAKEERLLVQDVVEVEGYWWRRRQVMSLWGTRKKYPNRILLFPNAFFLVATHQPVGLTSQIGFLGSLSLDRPILFQYTTYFVIVASRFSLLSLCLGKSQFDSFHAAPASTPPLLLTHGAVRRIVSRHWNNDAE